MSIMPYGRQAGLGKYLHKKRHQTLTKLDLSKQYYKTVLGYSAITPEMLALHDSTYLTGIFSIIEGFLTDVALEVYICFPDKLKDENIKLKDAFIGTHEMIQNAAEKQIQSLLYRDFSSIVEGVSAVFNNNEFIHASLADVIELKATRDIYVHNDGVPNDTYNRKAGAKARPCSVSDSRLPLGESYLISGTDAAIAFIKAFYDHGPKSMEDYGPAKAFEGMWQSTALSRLVPFTEAWEVVNADLVRPLDRGLNWAWSGSEKYLYDFFLHIYRHDYHMIDSTLQDAFRRWPISTNEGRIMLSWLAAPFYF